MPNTHEILTELVRDAINLDRHGHKLTPVVIFFDMTKAAIKTATAQIEAQQRERVEKLVTALNKIWTNPMTAELAQAIAGAALAEPNPKVNGRTYSEIEKNH